MRLVWLFCLVFFVCRSVDVVAELNDGDGDSPFMAARQIWRNMWNATASIFDCDDKEGDSDPTPTPEPTPAPNNDCKGGGADNDGCGGDTSGGGGGGPVPSSAPATSAPVPSAFTIALDLQGVSDDSVFRNAVAKWSQVIIGDLEDYTAKLEGTSSCGSWPSSVDDLYICGKYDTIDGPGGVLGSASPRHYRTKEKLPITGEMRFDIIDIQQGRIRDMLGVILHEMGHVLGIGSLWVVKGLTSSYSVPCPYKLDSAASREYQALSRCSGAIPVEHSISGSNCGHWAEGCFNTEVMTSAANSILPFSRLTIAGLEDLGYQVDYNQADSYGKADLNPNCRCNNRVRRTLWNGFDDNDDDDGEENGGKPSASSRRLSDEGHQIAFGYGQELLAQNRAQISLIPDSDDVQDIGGDVIYVLYYENDSIFSVFVSSEM